MNVTVRRVSVWAAAMSMLICFGSVPAFAGEQSMRSRPDAASVGIWKAVVPHGMQGELDSYDPIGLVAGAFIKADCSFNWRDPDDGKLFCFSTPTSLVYFEAWPKTYIRRAHDALDRLVVPKPGA
jgi:hypothetical protein